MRKTLMLTILAMVALAACAPAATLAPTVVAPPGGGAQPTPPVIETHFTPTDPATVNLAAGKPQLVEFFAFW